MCERCPFGLCVSLTLCGHCSDYRTVVWDSVCAINAPCLQRIIFPIFCRQWSPEISPPSSAVPLHDPQLGLPGTIPGEIPRIFRILLDASYTSSVFLRILAWLQQQTVCMPLAIAAGGGLLCVAMVTWWVC